MRDDSEELLPDDFQASPLPDSPSLVGSRPVPSEWDDQSLVELFRRGDRVAFEILVRRHRAFVVGIAQRMVKDSEAAQDLAQNTFLNVFERIDQLQGHFRPWLRRIVTNLSRNYLRDAALRQERYGLAVCEPASSRTDAGDALDLARFVRQIRSARAALPERQRTVFVLRIEQDLPFSEVAALLGITPNNAKVTYHYAVKRLRWRLRGVEPGHPARGVLRRRSRRPTGESRPETR